MEKFGLKEYIMTSIIELQLKNAIKINEITGEIELISKENLSYTQINAIHLLFPDSRKKVTTFEEINANFQDDEKLGDFLANFVNVKKRIIKEIIDLNIFSRPLYVLGQVISCISVLIIMDMAPFFSLLSVQNAIADSALELIKIVLLLFSILIIYIYYLKTKNMSSLSEIVIVEEKKGNVVFKSFDFINYIIILLVTKKAFPAKTTLPITMWFVIILEYTLAIPNIILSGQLGIYFFSIIILSILNYIINQAMPYTKYGKNERKKLLELKKYIKEYSLIKDRDLNAVIVWDEYLAYATAFGIPNKVTDKIYEKIYDSSKNKKFIYDFLTNNY